MPLNPRHISHIDNGISLGRKLEDIYAEVLEYKRVHAEDFDTSQPLDLSKAEHADEMLLNYGLSFQDIDEFAQQPCASFVNFHDSVAVTTKDYGKYIRKVAGR